MVKIVFNHKLCDNAQGCPEIIVCARALNVDVKDAALTLFKDNIIFFEERCKCNTLCACKCPLMKAVDTPAEEWAAKEEVRLTERDPNFLKWDRYNAEYIVPCHEVSLDDILKQYKDRTNLILEIINVAACVAEFAAIPILEFFPKSVYDKYYRKLCLRTIEDIKRCETVFGINELPCILFFKKGKLIGNIHGIYQNSIPQRVNRLKRKLNVITNDLLSEG